MQLIIAAVLAALLAGFGAGFYTENQLNKAEIQSMESSITSANEKAAIILKSEQDKLALAEANAINLKINLDKSYESTINALNTQHDTKLADFSLYTKRRDRCTSSVPGSKSTGISEETTSEAELDRETDRVIKEAAIVADSAAEYAERAYQFAFVNNCGITKTTKE